MYLMFFESNLRPANEESADAVVSAMQTSTVTLCFHSCASSLKESGTTILVMKFIRIAPPSIEATMTR